jgi:MFS family permease
MGGCLAGLFYGKVTDAIGRKPAMFWAQVITLIAIIIQSAARNIAMFVIARILLGVGNTASSLSGPTYIAETLPYKWRAWGLALFNDFFYIGMELISPLCSLVVITR